MKRQFIFLSMILVPATALFVVTLTIAMAFALRSDVTALDEKARDAARMQKDLRAEVATIRDDIAALRAAPASPPPAETAAPVATAEPTATDAPVVARNDLSSGPARAIKVGAVAPVECVFKAGDPYGLADCIRSQQGRIGRSLAKYR